MKTLEYTFKSNPAKSVIVPEEYGERAEELLIESYKLYKSTSLANIADKHPCIKDDNIDLLQRD